MNNGIITSEYTPALMPAGLLYKRLRTQYRSATTGTIWESSNLNNNISTIYGYWKPTDIPSCVSWFDATERSSYTISTGISQWRDLSGNNTHIGQSIANNQPVLSSMNGKDAFLFDGINDTLENTATTAPVNRVLSGASGISVYMVVQPLNNYFSFSYHWGATGASGSVLGDVMYMIMECNSSNRMSTFFRRLSSDVPTLQRTSPASSPVFFRNNIASVTSIRWNAYLGLLTASSNTVTAWPWFDGSNNGNPTSSSFTRGGNFGVGAGAFRIGQWNAYSNSLVGEFIVYNRPLSENENFIVINNLMSKWNIQQ